MDDRVVLILGGMRSGKSRRALALGEACPPPRVFVATARDLRNPDDTPVDPEMSRRIAAHRRHRPAHWKTVEAPLDLPAVLRDLEGQAGVVLVDCLTLWLTHLLEEGEAVERAFQALFQCLEETRGRILLVSNEVGSGVIPLTPLGRRFVDWAGYLNQEVARRADRVEWVVAGIPQVLKGKGTGP